MPIEAKATVTLNSEMPLLMHADNVEWSDRMDVWKLDPDNKKFSKPGDDRTPPWRWIGCLNTDDPKRGVVTIPSEYVMACIRAGAAEVPMEKMKSFKAVSQSGILCKDFHWPLLVDGKTISMAKISELLPPKKCDFEANRKTAEALGFSLFVKRVHIGQAKHIRVRPRFERWSVSGEVWIFDPRLTEKTLQSILDKAGQLKGLGDWRPGAKTPGPFGTFIPKITNWRAASDVTD